MLGYREHFYKLHTLTMQSWVHLEVVVIYTKIFLVLVLGDDRYIAVFFPSNDLTHLMVTSGDRGGWCHVESPRLGWKHSLQVSAFNQHVISDVSAIPRSGIENKALLLTTEGAVSLYMASEYSVYSPLPESALGKKYIVNTCIVGNSSTFQFVIATSSDSSIDIIFKISGSIVYEGKSYRNGNTLSLKLHKYQTFALNSAVDLTGTVVMATEPIAVFIATVRPDIFNNRRHMTAAIDQLVPVENYGKEFVVSVYDRTSKYQLQLIGEHRDTVVTFNDGRSITTTDGRHEELVGPLENKHFTANMPVMVTLCRKFERYSGFMVVPPVAASGDAVAMYKGPHTMKILTRRNVTVRAWMNDRDLSSVEWNYLPNSDFKVGTPESSTVFINSTGDVSVLVFHADHVHRGGHTGRYSRTLNEKDTTSVTFSSTPVLPIDDNGEADWTSLAIGLSLGCIILALVIILFVVCRKRNASSTTGTKTASSRNNVQSIECSIAHAQSGEEENRTSQYIFWNTIRVDPSGTRQQSTESPHDRYASLDASAMVYHGYASLEPGNQTEIDSN